MKVVKVVKVVMGGRCVCGEEVKVDGQDSRVWSEENEMQCVGMGCDEWS